MTRSAKAPGPSLADAPGCGGFSDTLTRLTMASDDKRTVDEILRRRGSPSDADVQYRLHDYQDLSGWPPHARALVPVGVVAQVETVVRDTIRHLVDAGPPFVDRVADLDLRVRPGIEAMKALHGRKISLGEWVSHLVRVSSIAHVQDHLATLLGVPDFKTFLGSVRYFDGPSPADLGANPEEFPDDIEEAPILVEDPVRVVASLGKLFAARHQAAHEAGPPEIPAETLGVWTEDAVLFCDALRTHVNATLHPLDPTNTLTMNLKASVGIERAQADLDASIAELSSRLRTTPDDPDVTHGLGFTPVSSAEFASMAHLAQTAFEAYRRAETDFQSQFWPEGSGATGWFLAADLSLVEERLARVQESLQIARDFYGDPDAPLASEE